MDYRSPSPTKPNHRTGRLAGLLILIAFVAAASWIVLNRQSILDQLMVWQYHPTAEVQAIAAKADMSDHGRFYFYTSQPEVSEANVFNQQCRKQEEHSAILGCYADRRIYIYNVTNQQLDGIKEVTAAHEMLHAAWDRLSDSEKKRLEPLLTATYDRVATDELRDRMAYYQRTQPGERFNELHSIIATEVSDVGPELEQYYAQYFTNRQQVAAQHQSYETVFLQLKERGDALSSQLTALGNEIEQSSASYNSGVTQLNAEITSFNAKAQNGGFSSQAAFNAERSSLMARSAELDSQRTAINAKIVSYNAIRDELETINSQSEALTRSIDSTLAPAPAI